MHILKRVRQGALIVAAASIALPMAAQSQNRTADVMLEEIIVTGTKRAGGIDVQDAPVAITAYNESQLDAMHIRDVSEIGYSAPSVQLEDIGTARGVANFSVRGLGVNSSIPSIDPTVGVFVDGMYLGINAGVVLDIFDLEGIEVLRGPQGLLFGKNVTGGAVLLRTTRPTEHFRFKGRLASETGTNQYASALISGPLNDELRAKFAVHYNNDSGWHRNLFNDAEHGEAQTSLFRGALEWDIADGVDSILRLEHGRSEGDGPASQNAGLFSTESFGFSIDERGNYDYDWNHAILETTFDVDFGDGEIVNILGWRQYESSTLGDIDASPIHVFHARSRTEQDQLSNELRYSGSFNNVYLTSGIYYFRQDLFYLENRLIPALGVVGLADATGGGTQDGDTWAVFTSADIALNDVFSINIGGRYTRENKEARISAIPFNACTIADGCAAADLDESQSWSNFTPKIGLQIRPNESTLLYGFWTKGFRSGGYNMRHTAVAIPNEGFDDEEQSSFEVGVKKDFADSRVRINAAAYYNVIDNMQRELNLPGTFGVVQLIRNTADATISGLDLEASWVMTDSLFLSASVGYVDGQYDEVLFDISNDGSGPLGPVTREDYELNLPRLAPWTYGAQLTYTRDFSWGGLTVQGSGYRRDTAYYTDNNLGSLRAADMFDASVIVDLLDGRLSLSAYGKNLKDEVTIGGDTQLPASFPGSPGFPIPSLAGSGATFSPLAKGRIYGFELIYRIE